MLKELEYKRFTEAKRRLRYFLVHTDGKDLEEKNRLLKYYTHRYATLITIIKDCMRSKRISKTSKAIRGDDDLK